MAARLTFCACVCVCVRVAVCVMVAGRLSDLPEIGKSWFRMLRVFVSLSSDLGLTFIRRWMVDGTSIGLS